MEMGRLFILNFLVVLFAQCSTTSNKGAVAITWSEDPTPESSKILAIVPNLPNGELEALAVKKLNALGFVVGEKVDNDLRTEEKPMEGNVMRLMLSFQGKGVVIAGELGYPDNQGDILWRSIYRGEGDLASAEWKLMTTYAHSLNPKEISFSN